MRLTCGVLGFSPQANYAWLAAPISARDLSDAYLINVLVDAHSGWRQLRIVTVAAPTGRSDIRWLAARTSPSPATPARPVVWRCVTADMTAALISARDGGG